MKTKLFSSVLAAVCFFLNGAETSVNASTFGFDPDDATECIKRAIASGSGTVVVDNVGKDWIISRTINLPSNFQLIVDRDVTIRTKKGAFVKCSGVFISVRGKNIAFKGRAGSKIIMNKADYRNPKLYPQSESRHTLSFIGVKNLSVAGITLKDSGGDAINLAGFLKDANCNENVLIENVVFDSPMRLGLSAVSVSNLTVRNCKFLNAEGCPPAGGIDFEPNRDAERIENSIVENCLFNGNKGPAFSFAPSKLSADSRRANVILRNCSFENNWQSLYIHPFYFDKKKNRTMPVSGCFTVENCRINDPVQFRDPVNSVKTAFRKCTFAQKKKSSLPFFHIIGQNANGFELGNIHFEDCSLEIGADGTAIGAQYSGSSLFAPNAVSGKLSLRHGGTTGDYDFAKFNAEASRRFKKFSKFKTSREPKLDELKIPRHDAARKGNGNMFFRGGDFIQYAEPGQKISLVLNTRRNGYDSAISCVVKDPGGIRLTSTTVTPGKKGCLEFTAPKRGLYTVETLTFNSLDIDSPHRGSGWKMKRGAVSLLLPSGHLYFTIPAGVKNFNIGVEASPQTEVSLKDQTGRRVSTVKAGELTIIRGERANVDKTEVWSLLIRKAVWSVSVRMYEPLPGIISTNPDVLPF